MRKSSSIYKKKKNNHFPSNKMSVFRNLIKINKISQCHPLKLTKFCSTQFNKFNDNVDHQSNIIQRSFHTSAMFLVERNLKTDPSSSLHLEHIYTGNLSHKMKAVKVFSLTTSIIGLAIQPMIVEQGSKIGGTSMIIFLCTFAGFFTFITPTLLHFITKKYVTQMHYNNLTDEYIATTISFFLRKKEIKFKVEEVRVPDIAAMFTTFTVGKHSLFIEPTLFSDPKHYVKIMGYDKPLDFKLEMAGDKPKTNGEK